MSSTRKTGLAGGKSRQSLTSYPDFKLTWIAAVLILPLGENENYNKGFLKNDREVRYLTYDLGSKRANLGKSLFI